MNVFPFLDDVEQPVSLSTRLLSVEPQAIGTSFQESLPSYLNRLAMVHAVPVATLLSREVIPELNLGETVAASSFLGVGSKYLLLGENMAAKVASRLAILTGVPEVAGLVHPFLSGSLGWTRDFRDYSAWCPECFAEWGRAGEPLYFPLLWSFREVHCCLRHNVPLVEACPYCGQRVSFLTSQVWDGTCGRCKRKFSDVRGLGLATQQAIDFTRLVEGLVGWSAGLTEQADFASVLVGNIKRAATFVGGGKPLSAVLGLSPSVVGFWLRGRQTPTLSSLLRLSYVFDVPLERWFSSSMLSFQVPKPMPDVPWLMDRAKAVESSVVEAALTAALESTKVVSLLALAKVIPSTPARLYQAFPDLSKRIVERYRQHLSEEKVAYAAKLTKLVTDGIA